MDLRKLSFYQKQKLKQIKSKDIFLAYRDLRRALTEKYGMEQTKTIHEIYAKEILKRHYKLGVETSVWIGPRNIDLFIPSMRLYHGAVRFNGLAIEIDGGIHNEEHKMKKDQAKFEYLNFLKISSVRFNNEDIPNGKFENFIIGLKNHYYPDTRTRQRLMRKIHIETILYHQDLIISKNITLCKALLPIFERSK